MINEEKSGKKRCASLSLSLFLSLSFSLFLSLSLLSLSFSLSLFLSLCGPRGYIMVNYTALVETLFMLFPDEEPYSDSGPDRCRLCALVGNSGNLEGSHYGPLIDAHDFVIRMNTGPTKGYEKDVGSKTTHRAIYPESAVDMDNSTHLVLVPFKVLDLISANLAFKTVLCFFFCCLLLKVMILHPEFITYVYTKWLQKQGKYPSTGFLMLVFSLHICDQVNVFGFGARKDGSWHHYFDKRYGIFHNTPEHKGSVEFDIIEELHLLNKIHLL
uniref:ST3 beta-galactoside alpha-2,3-sialyltransferase 1 n=1 Tax=Astyanax mexicanus TaxID=7994 RepID=A0A3B1IND1_ASTMX